MRICLLLIDGFSLMSYASFIEPFRAANILADGELYQWTHLSWGSAAARASNGVTLIVDAMAPHAVDCEMLFVFAAGDPATFTDQACFAWLRSLARHGVSIGGVSGGPYLLARAGLLGGRRATIHWEHAASLQEEFPHIPLESGLYTIDGDRMTCAGGSASFDLALAIIERDHGIRLRLKVAEWFIGVEQRGPDIAQRANLAERYGTTNRRLIAMLSSMEGALEEPLSRDKLARCAGISLRQLERLCIDHLGKGVAETYLAIRLDRATELLRSSAFPIAEIAILCGFRSAAHFSRRFRQRFGAPPSQANRPEQRNRKR